MPRDLETLIKTYGVTSQFIKWDLLSKNLLIPQYPTEVSIRPLRGGDERDLLSKLTAIAGKGVKDVEVMTSVLGFIFKRLTDVEDGSELLLSDRVYTLFLTARTTLGNLITIPVEGGQYVVDLSALPVDFPTMDSLEKKIRDSISQKVPELIKDFKLSTIPGNILAEVVFNPPAGSSETEPFSLGLIAPKGKNEVTIASGDYSGLVYSVDGSIIDRGSMPTVMAFLEVLPASYWKAIRVIIEALGSFGLDLNAKVDVGDPTANLTVTDVIGAAIASLLA